MANSLRPFTPAEYFSILNALRDSYEHHTGINPGMTIQAVVRMQPWPVAAVRALYRELAGSYLPDNELLAIGAVSDDEYKRYVTIMEAI